MATSRTTRSVLRHASWIPLIYLATLVLIPFSTSHGADNQSSLDFLTAEPADPVVLPISWDEPPAASGSEVAGDQVSSLTKRVEELERYIRDQERIRTAAAQEESEPDAGAEDAPEECVPKKIDILAKPTVRVTGRIFVDGISYDDDDDTSAFFDRDRENEFGFDTIRIGMQGQVYENMSYYWEVEFEGTEVDFKDVYVEWNLLPVIGNVRAGHFKEPLSLEEITSDAYTTFMERSPANQTFAPARMYGVMLYNHLDACQNASWFAGVFRNDSDDSPNAIATQRDDRNDWSLTTRFAWLPYYDEPSEGRYLVHLGTSYSYRNASDFAGNGNGFAEFGTGAYVGNQAPIGVGAEGDTDEWNEIGYEAAIVWGAFSVQAEYYHDFLTSGEEYNGAYGQVSYFLTGEHRVYRKDRKAFDRVEPFEPAFLIHTCRGCSCGRGAWEVAAGYSFVDLEDGHDIAPGTLERAFVDGFVFGVNWYLNANARMMFDYYHEMTDFVNAGTPDSDANIFGIRWQLDW
jgi:phosphate-selective porin OprO/OprP